MGDILPRRRPFGACSSASPSLRSWTVRRSLAIATTVVCALTAVPGARAFTPTPTAAYPSTVRQAVATDDYVVVSGANSDGMARVLAHDGTLVDTISVTNGAPITVLGDRLYFGGPQGMTVWDLAGLPPFSELENESLEVSVGAMANTGGRVWFRCSGNLCSVTPGTAAVTETPTSDTFTGLEVAAGQPGALWSMGFPFNGTVRRWDASAATGSSVSTTSMSGPLAAAPNGDVVFGFAGGQLRLYDGDDLTQLPGTLALSGADDIVVSADGGRLFAAAGRAIHVFDTTSMLREFVYESPLLSVDRLAVSPDGSSLFAFGRASLSSNAAAVLTLPADFRRSTLTVEAPRNVEYGAQGIIRVRLPEVGDTLHREVRLYRSIAGGADELIAEGTVNANGVMPVDEVFRRNAVYRAYWAGDDTFVANEAKTRVNVRVIIAGDFRDHYGKQGAYSLYRRGDVVRYLVNVKPNHAGEGVEMLLERYRDGRWRRVAGLDLKLDARSRTGVAVRNARGGARYRLIARFFGDGDHARTVAKPAYFRLT